MKTTAADRGIVKLPALAPHLEFHVIGEQQTLLVSESFNTLLHGEIYCKLLPVLDGRREQEEIAAVLKAGHTASEVRAAIASLAARGYVVSGGHGMDRSRAAYWSSLGASPCRAEQSLAESRIEILGDEGRLARHMEELGVTAGTAAPKLTVIVCDEYLQERLAEVNRHRLESGVPWMLMRPRGIQPLFGPVFRADGEGPCWACLAYRLGGHQEVHQFLRNVVGEKAAFKPFAADPVLLDALYGLIAAEIVKWLVLDEAAPLHEQAMTMDIGTFTSSRHRVMRRPQCPACGDEDLFRADRPPVALQLKSSPRAVSNSGGARTVAPEATLAKYRHLVSPISGVVTWLKRT
ncbi:MAG: TOMM precursor leader peptide-binding protein, partial [Gammaproteobacteria bacterium]|nr:TOMM precursor leader peptide-binding protein [Gammaproteobacteria bacterium]